MMMRIGEAAACKTHPRSAAHDYKKDRSPAAS